MKKIENKNIIYVIDDNVEYIQFKKLLEYGIKHAYTLKRDGVNFRSTNPELEMESYNKLFDSLKLDINTFTKPLQKHTSVVKCIDRPHEKKELPNIDGLITDKKGISLCTTNADCILFMFFDPVKNVIANVHSGWRGTFQKIGEKAINKMVEYYKCNPKDILVFICPSIRKCHFEVDEDVKELCEEIFGFTNRLDEFIFKGEIKDGKQKYYIDTVMINKIIFRDECGIKAKNIIDSNICSVCHSDKVHSYRAEGKDFKLATAVISLD